MQSSAELLANAPAPVTYDREAALPAVGFVAFAGGLGLGIAAGSVLLALTLVLLITVLIASRSASRGVRRMLAQATVHRRRLERRRGRERRLEVAGVRLEQLTELTLIVDEIEAGPGDLAARFELDELLDQCADLAIAHERCRRAMRMADRDQLLRELTFARSRPGSEVRRRPQVIERRLRCWDECASRADCLADELGSIAEFIRLLGQRSSCPEVADSDDGLSRRLVDLDEHDCAMRQLAE